MKITLRWTRRAALCGAAILGAANPIWGQDASETAITAERLVAELGLREAPTPVRERPGWAPPRKVVVRGDAEFVRSLRSVAPGVELVPASNHETAVREAREADALLGFCSAEVLEAGTRVQWIQIFSAGAERCVSVPEVGRRGLLLTNAQRIYGPEMAEHVLAMLLAFTRGLHTFIPQQMEGSWERSVPRDRMWEINGKTMLVVGLGGIGTEVARRAHALGMRVVATRRSSREGPDFVEYVGLSDELEDLVTEADVVVTALPLTPETTGLFDADFFAAMKSDAYFINVGRGKSVVTDDLIAALQSGELAGAGLDVTDPEPLPAGHPLWRLPNVIITPHVAARSVQAVERLQAVVRENLRRYVAGEPMLSVVSVERGY